MLCVLLFGMPVLAALLTHRWWLAVECAGIGWLVYWGVPRLLRLAISGTVTGTRWAGRWSLRTVQRWWKGLVMVLALGVLLTGCADAGFWWARTQGFSVDGNTACPAVQVHDGHCPAGVHQEVQR